MAMAPAVLLGVALAFLAVLRPVLALLILVVLDVSNLNGVIAGHLGVSPYKAELALALVALAVVLARDRPRLSWSPVLLGLLVLFAGFCVTLFGAADPAASQQLLGERLRDLCYFILVYLLLVCTGAIRHVAQAAVLILAALAGLTVVHEFVLNNNGDLFGLSRVPLMQEGGAFTARHAGTSSDVNFWGRLLILYTPLAFSLWAATTRRTPRLVWLGCGLSMLAGVYLTQSRGGLIAVFLAIVVWLLLAGGRVRKSLLLMPIVAAVLIPVSGIGSRIGTLAVSSGGGADLSVLTRKRLQVNALQMFLDQPVNGHGIGSFPSIFPRYDRLADTYQPIDIVVAAHNLYLEQAADGGIVLLLAWGVFVGSVLFVALRARAIARRAPDPVSAWLANGVIAGLVGWLVASAFLHLSDFRALLTIAALAAALDVHCRRLSVPTVEPSAARRRTGPAVMGLLAAVTLVGVAGVAVSLATGQVTYRSSSTLAVVPAATGASGGRAYQLDVISRGVIVPTLATVLEYSISPAAVEHRSGRSGPASIAITPSAQGGALVVEVTALDREAAEALGKAAVDLAKDEVEAINSGYRLSGGKGEVEAIRPARRWLAAPSLLAVVLGGFGLVRAYRRRRLIQQWA